jgi:hypothetical protein
LYDSSAKQNKKILKAKKAEMIILTEKNEKWNIKQWHLGVFENKLF